MAPSAPAKALKRPFPPDFQRFSTIFFNFQRFQLVFHGFKAVKTSGRYSSGYGLGSFPARVRPENVEDAVHAMRAAPAQEWPTFIGHVGASTWPFWAHSPAGMGLDIA